MNADCTGIIRAEPLPGVVIEERMVVVDDGREIRAAVMRPVKPPRIISGSPPMSALLHRREFVATALTLLGGAAVTVGCGGGSARQQPNPDANEFGQCFWCGG